MPWGEVGFYDLVYSPRLQREALVRFALKRGNDWRWLRAVRKGNTNG